MEEEEGEKEEEEDDSTRTQEDPLRTREEEEEKEDHCVAAASSVTVEPLGRPSPWSLCVARRSSPWRSCCTASALTYLLISASSSAATRVEDWESNWGKDKFPDMAKASVVMSFLAFVALAISSLISGYTLSTLKST